MLASLKRTKAFKTRSTIWAGPYPDSACLWGRPLSGRSPGRQNLEWRLYRDESIVLQRRLAAGGLPKDSPASSRNRGLNISHRQQPSTTWNCATASVLSHHFGTYFMM